MFHSARLKLTAWYLLIIMLISIFFSVAIYHASTREIQRVIGRVEFRQQFPRKPMPEGRFLFEKDPSPPSLTDLEQAKKQIFIALAMVNSGILLFSGFAGYFLAGRTLRPIKIMIDEQNQFISSASHELRTPIATLRAEMEGSLLEKHISDIQVRKLIKSNLEELGSLQDLSSNLLRIAQVHNSKPGKYMENISLLRIIKTAQKKITPLAKKKHITITSEITDSHIKGDKSSLVEVFVILLDNAIKYSKEKTAISIKSVEEGTSLVVSVADQGIGIDSSDLPYIFDRFYRADPSRSKADGYGLGLSIAKKNVEMHNGSIRVVSSKKGSTFTLRFPLIPS